MDKYFTYMQSSTSTTGQQQTTLQALLSFYRQKWYRKKQWDSSRAKRRSLDLAMDTVLDMVKTTVPRVDDEGKPVLHQDRNAATRVLHGSRRKDPLLPPVVIYIGLAQFNTKTSLPSKHAKPIRRFVQVAHPQGYIVVGCNEYFTSVKCSRQDCNEFLESLPNRSKYCRTCRTCRMHFDRDGVGAENIARICQSQLQHQRRPPTPQEPSPTAATPPVDASSSTSDKSKTTRRKGPLTDEALIQRVRKRSQRSHRPQPTSNRG